MTLDLDAPIRAWMPLVLYGGFRPGLPDMLLGRWPAALRQPQPFKAWVCETPTELALVSERLERPVLRGPCGELDFATGPDGALGPGRGAAPCEEAVVALYEPPEPGWPWLVLASSAVTMPGAERGRYAWEAYASEAAALDILGLLYATADRAGATRREPRPARR